MACAPAPARAQTPGFDAEIPAADTVLDDFRWLENGDNPEVQKWALAQSSAARRVLDALPGRGALRARLESLLKVGTIRQAVSAGPKLFYLKREGLKNQPALYVRDTPRSEPRILLDPNALSEDGTAALDWWYPSPDGLMLAYGLSEKGSEDSVLHVREVDSAVDLPDIIERTRHASVSWLPDRTGFYYTKYPRPGAVPPGEEQYHRSVYFHRMGEDPGRDTLVFGLNRAKEDWPDVSVSRDGRYLLVSVSQGWSKTELYVRDLRLEDSVFVPITAGEEAVYDGQIHGDTLYVRTNEWAPRYKLMAVDLKKPLEKWRELIPEGPFILTGFDLAGSVLAVSVLERAASRMRLHAPDGKVLKEIPLPPLGTVNSFDGQPKSKSLAILYESFFVPPTLYHYDIARSSLTVLEKVPAPADLSDYESRQVTYESKDKTPVTMFLVHKKRTYRNGKNPVLLTGYGGFNIEMTPSFSPALLAWLEKGGLYALPNLRGGGEYGEAWHKAGMRGNKQNVFDDFIAAGRWLVAREYTRPELLAVSGGSNGGLLVGAAMTQAPELFKAAVCSVPLLDMLRYDKFLLGKLWVPEYGSPDDPEAFKWLKAYSPYHRVKKGVRYPAVLFLSGDSDSRVDPMHARKMTAVLQRDAAAGTPVLLRLDLKAGHGAGKPLGKTIDELTDRYGFLFWQLGM